MPFFGLIHSPLVGPSTWEPVAHLLEQAGHTVAIPALTDNDAPPFWQQHAASAAKGLAEFTAPCILVGHSGAGPLLPLIGAELNAPIAAYLFVDAGLPSPSSRLDMLKTEIPTQAEGFETFLRNGGRYPQWQDTDLQPLVPDTTHRQQLLAELHPRGLPFFTEPLPVPAGWDTTPCGYLQLSPGYALPAEQARQKNWPVLELQAAHFHILTDPPAVATALLHLTTLLLP